MGHDVVVEISAEFTIEPFVEGAPGPHVRAAIDVAEAAGLAVDVGPFGTAVSGESESVQETVDAVVRAAIDHGATRVSLQLTVPCRQGDTGRIGVYPSRLADSRAAVRAVGF